MAVDHGHDAETVGERLGGGDISMLAGGVSLPRITSFLVNSREGFRPDGPRHYDRIVVESRDLTGGRPVRARCYVYGACRVRQIPGASLLGSGDWTTCARLP